MTRHQYGISALVSLTSFLGETDGGVGKCRLFSQAMATCKFLFQEGVVQPRPQALLFSHGRGERETRVTGDEPKEPWEGYRRRAKRRLARCLLPAFLCTHIERETSGYEAGGGI